MAHKWYSIQTYGSEKAVREAILNMIEEMGLQDYIAEVIVPTEDIIEVKDGKKKMRQLGSVEVPSEAFTAVLKLD